MAKGREKANQHAPVGGFFLLTYIGTLIYFIQEADGAAEVLFAFLQALVWPAFLIHRVFELLRI